MVFVWVLYLLLYLLICGAYYSMFRKAGTAYAWLAFIPVANLWPLLWTLQRSAWHVLWLLIPFVNVIVALIWQVQLLRAFGMSSWWVLLVFIPLLDLVYIGVLLYMGYGDKVHYVLPGGPLVREKKDHWFS